MSRHATALPEPTGGGPPDAETDPEPPADPEPPGAPRNEVVLVGRLAAEVEERTLPSGDVLATWRLVVDRPPARPRRDGGRPVTVDTLDCVAWTARLRQSARRLRPGDVVAGGGGAAPPVLALRGRRRQPVRGRGDRAPAAGPRRAAPLTGPVEVCGPTRPRCRRPGPPGSGVPVVAQHQPGPGLGREQRRLARHPLARPPRPAVTPATGVGFSSTAVPSVRAAAASAASTSCSYADRVDGVLEPPQVGDDVAVQHADVQRAPGRRPLRRQRLVEPVPVQVGDQAQRPAVAARQQEGRTRLPGLRQRGRAPPAGRRRPGRARWRRPRRARRASAASQPGHHAVDRVHLGPEGLRVDEEGQAGVPGPGAVAGLVPAAPGAAGRWRTGGGRRRSRRRAARRSAATSASDAGVGDRPQPVPQPVGRARRRRSGSSRSASATTRLAAPPPSYTRKIGSRSASTAV